MKRDEIAKALAPDKWQSVPQLTARALGFTDNEYRLLESKTRKAFEGQTRRIVNIMFKKGQAIRHQNFLGGYVWRANE